jgi:hypothetical protein
MLHHAVHRTTSTDPYQPGNGRDTGEHAGTALPMTPDDFCSWVAKAMPGDVTVYHRGHLGRDRCRSTTDLAERDRRRLVALAQQALLVAEDGRVHLVQRRHGEGDYSYFAVRRRVPPGRAARPQSTQAKPKSRQ